MFRNRLKPTVAIALLGTVAVIVLSGACQKLDPEVAGPRLTIDESPFADGIAADYGRLVSAVPHENGRWISFWFERRDSSLVGVWVDTRTGAVRKVIDIPRK